MQSDDSFLKLHKTLHWSPVGSFSSESQKKVWHGNVMTDNDLVGLIDETRRDTCRIAFFLQVFSE